VCVVYTSLLHYIAKKKTKADVVTKSNQSDQRFDRDRPPVIG